MLGINADNANVLFALYRTTILTTFCVLFQYIDLVPIELLGLKQNMTCPIAIPISQFHTGVYFLGLDLDNGTLRQPETCVRWHRPGVSLGSLLPVTPLAGLVDN